MIKSDKKELPVIFSTIISPGGRINFNKTLYAILGVADELTRSITADMVKREQDTSVSAFGRVNDFNKISINQFESNECILSRELFSTINVHSFKAAIC